MKFYDDETGEQVLQLRKPTEEEQLENPPYYGYIAVLSRGEDDPGVYLDADDLTALAERALRIIRKA